MSSDKISPEETSAPAQVQLEAQLPIRSSSAVTTLDLDQLRKKLEEELVFSEKLLAGSEKWIPELRKKISGVHRETNALPTVCAFFAQWSLHLWRGIFTLIQNRMFASSFLLLRSLLEAHMELSFILHKDCGKRASEYLQASRENRAPYRDRPGFESFVSLGRRSGSCGLGELYRKTYLSLSYYSHLRVKGSLAFGPDSQISLKEAIACLTIGQTLQAKVAKQLSRAFAYQIPNDLAQDYAQGLKRYKSLVRQQEDALARKKKEAQT